MNECWATIPGYEGIYEVSNFGNIYSLPRDVHHPDGRVQHRNGKMKEFTPDKDGYMIVSLSKDAKNHKVKVHRLVAMMFVDGWFDGAEVDHIDRDRTNNRADNLRWVTHRENVVHIRDGK